MTERPATPLCKTTPGGIPVRLLVDAEPRSPARRALPVVLFLLLAAGVAAVALAGCGPAAGPQPSPAVVNRVQEIRGSAPPDGPGAVVPSARDASTVDAGGARLRATHRP